MTQYSKYCKYTEENVDNLVPSKAGVYKISGERTEPNKVYPVYIGKTDDLKRRLSEHLSKNETNVCLKDKVKKGNLWISWTEISTQLARTAEETEKIKTYRPECNTHHNT